MNYYIALYYVDVLYCYDVFYDVISYMVYIFILHCILLTLYGNVWYLIALRYLDWNWNRFYKLCITYIIYLVICL